MMVEQLADARDRRRDPAQAALAAARSGSPRGMSPYALRLRAALPRAHGRSGRALLAGRAQRPAAALAPRRVRRRVSSSSPHRSTRRSRTIAAHYLLLIHLLQNALIADVAPLLVMLGLTPGMRDALARRGLGRLRSRWILPVWLLAWYLTHLAPFYDWALRTGWGLNIEHGILIAVGLLFWWPIVSGRLTPATGLAYLAAATRRLGVPRTRVHLLQPSVLRVLRARAAALGTVAGARPEPRRDPHERRADARVPARDRLLRHAACSTRSKVAETPVGGQW